MVHQDRIRIRTSGQRDMHDVTAQVAEIVARSGIRTGIGHIFVGGGSEEREPF